MKKFEIIFITLFITHFAFSQQKPNVIYIYADDLGYGDVSYNGATKLNTPNIDQLANQGIVFSNGHTTSATCTPSRYALMTGRYPWRQEGTGILPGDAALIIPANKTTLPLVFQQAGYQTGIVGKWHLGLGEAVQKNWNVTIKPGPNEVGFNFSYIFPATADRVPTVFIENGNVVGLDLNDPIKVSYKEKLGDDPTGKEHPELLKMHTDPIQGHDQTIVNNIGRIGYMTGGKTARWTDEELSFTFLEKAKQFMEGNKSKPFFLYFALTSPHVPIAPDEDFKGTSKAGAYGDFIQETDWAVSQIIVAVKNAGISDNTIIIFTSDNGSPGQDGTNMSGEMNSIFKYDHYPNAPFKGMKTDLWEGGHHVPFIVSWPGKIKSNTISTETICHSDLLATCADILKTPIPLKEAEDSYSLLSLLLDGKNNYERPYTIHHSGTGIFAIRQGDWKLIMTGNSGGGLIPSKAELINGVPVPLQLYNMKNDLQEANNLYLVYPEKVKELKNLLLQAKNSNGTKYSIRRKY